MHGPNRPIPAPGALPELVKEMREALEGVVRVADRNTDEFDRARAAIAKGAPILFSNDGSCEAQFIADGDHLNCPACGGSGHVDDALAYAEQCRAEVWMPIETLEEGVEALLFCEDYAPHFFVGSYTMRTRHEDVLVSEKGRRRTYEWTELEERDWGNAPNYGATHWMPLPAPPALQSAFADDEGVKRG